MHAARAIRPSLQQAVKIAIVAALVNLVDWAVRANVLARTTAHPKGTDASAQGSGQCGNALFSPANNCSGYFRFNLSNPGLDVANKISTTFQFSTADAWNGVGFEFPELPDGFPGDASES